MKKIINRKVYDTDTAELICLDGVLNRDGCTRSTVLYKTKKENYFFLHKTMWQGEYNEISLCDEEEAVLFYENASFLEIEFEKAFPNIKIEEG